MNRTKLNLEFGIPEFKGVAVRSCILIRFMAGKGKRQEARPDPKHGNSWIFDAFDPNEPQTPTTRDLTAALPWKSQQCMAIPMSFGFWRTIHGNWGKFGKTVKVWKQYRACVHD